MPNLNPILSPLLILKRVDIVVLLVYDPTSKIYIPQNPLLMFKSIFFYWKCSLLFHDFEKNLKAFHTLFWSSGLFFVSASSPLEIKM